MNNTRKTKPTSRPFLNSEFNRDFRRAQVEGLKHGLSVFAELERHWPVLHFFNRANGEQILTFCLVDRTYKAGGESGRAKDAIEAVTLAARLAPRSRHAEVKPATLRRL